MGCEFAETSSFGYDFLISIQVGQRIPNLLLNLEGGTLIDSAVPSTRVLKDYYWWTLSSSQARTGDLFKYRSNCSEFIIENGGSPAVVCLVIRQRDL